MRVEYRIWNEYLLLMTLRIGWLGLGAMGRRMARRLIAAGHDVTVWSRSGAPPELPELRERFRKTPREAVTDVDVAIAMVTDDEASRRVWLDPRDGALAGLSRGALVVESSTISPAWALALASNVVAHGASFLDAPVVGSRPQADAGALVYLVGGRAEDVARARPVLSAMGNAVHPMGATPNGALAKLAVNTLFSAQVALLGELIEASRRSGLDVGVLLEMMATLPVSSPAAKVAGAAILMRRFEPMFPIALVAKDLRYALAAAHGSGASLPLTERVVEILERAVAHGFEAENITAVAKLHEREPTA